MTHPSTSYRIELLNRKNYDTWKVQAKAVMIKAGLWNYVLNPKPPNTEKDPDVIAKYEDNELLARSELLLIISSQEIKYVKNCLTAKNIWQKLEDIYESKRLTKKASLLKQLIVAKYKEGDDLREHLDNLTDIVDKLANMNVDINADLLSVIMLYSLSSKFENFRIAIESRDKLPSPEELKIKILEETEARKHTEDIIVETNAMYTKKNYVPYKNKQDFCQICKKQGHKTKNCRFRNDRKKKERSNAAQNICLATEPNKNTKRWCIDSGCTSHMCHNLKSFSQINKSDGILKLAADDSTAKIEGRGNVQIKVDDKNIKLEDSLYVPNLATNLLSVSKITKKGKTVLFKENTATVKDSKTRKIELTAKNINGLYYLMDKKDDNDFKCQEETTFNAEIDDWHRKLGHINETSLKQALKDQAMNGLKFDMHQKLKECEVCIKGKMTRLPFPKNNQNLRTSQRLEIVHSDVCGPMNVESVSGGKYFVTFIDEYSRYSRVYIIQKKNEVLNKFKIYKEEMERFTGNKIKYLQSDNGTEYINKEFNGYLNQCGISRRLSCAYTPQQNGTAERKNRSLQERARCLLIDGNMPEKYWAEAVSTANYLLNRTPSKVIENKTPFEIWVGRKPSVQHLQIFGSKAFVLNKNKKQKKKFTSKVTEGIFLGYSENSKAYRILVPETHHVIVSRDVKVINKLYYENIDKIDKSENKNEKKLIDIFVDSKKENNEVYQQPEDCEIFADIHNDHEENELKNELLQNNENFFDHNEVIENEAIQTDDNSVADRNEVTDAEAIERNDILENKRPQRTRKPPVWTKDYICTVCMSEDDLKWNDAIISEITAHLKNDTWSIVKKPPCRNVIDSKIILKDKLGTDGNIVRKKARLVARGFSQIPGVDYQEVFAPVTRLSSIRLLVALAVQKDMHLNQIDICTAFLNGDIEEEIYMKKPKNIEEYLEKIIKSTKDAEIKQKAKKMLHDLNQDKENTVCKLNKAVYGLKQSGRQWYKKLDTELKSIGFKPTKVDPCMYIYAKGGETIIISIYVDDIIIACKSQEKIDNIKKLLIQRFEMRDLGEINYCLGITFERNEKQMILKQRQYIETILEKFGCKDCKPASTPMNTGLKLTKGTSPTKEKDIPYQNLIGSLMYLAVATRPDIMFAVSHLSQFNNCYTSEHFQAAKRVLRYLQGTKDLGLTYIKGNMKLEGAADADWASCAIDRRSVTGYVFTYGGTPISWEAKKQRTVALSTAEAEYMALTEASKEAIYQKNLLNELNIKTGIIDIYNDNQAAQKLVKNPTISTKSKHISIKEHFIRDAMKDRHIDVKYRATDDMEADVLTKALPAMKFIKLRTKINIV